MIDKIAVTTDDLCLSTLVNFKWFDELKEKTPDLKVVAFTIANYQNKESLKDSKNFKEWYKKRQDWIEIAVHSYDHLEPPDGDREDEAYWAKQARDSLKQFLPKKYGYRSAGWQTTNKTVSILKKLGFSYIAYETKIKDLKQDKLLPVRILNSHLNDSNSLQKIYREVLKNYS